MKRAKNWQKLIDRSVGVVLVISLGCLRKVRSLFKTRESPADPRSLAVLCVAALGDLLLLSAVIREFRTQFPECKITLFCGPDNKALVPLVDPDRTMFSEVIVLDPKKTLQNLGVLKNHRYQVVVDAGQWARWSALMSFLIPANWRIGFRTPNQWRHFLFDESVPHQNTRHEIENFKYLFGSWIEASTIVPRIGASKLPNALKAPYIVCHLFPSGASPFQKEWPREYWLDLFQELQKAGYPIALTGGPADRIRLERTFSSQELSTLEDRVGRLSLSETRDLLAGASLVISVNTGIMHLAASLGVPLIALHGPTNAKRWGPVSKEARVIQSSLSCSPCLNLGFEYGCPRNDCMKKITPEEVLHQVQKILQLPS